MDRGAPVVVALTPHVYSTAIASLLRNEGFDHVVVASAEARSGTAAMAVVDGSLPPVDAHVVIHLPGTAADGREVVVDLRAEPTVALGGAEELLVYLRTGSTIMRG
jgi:hypothetical protein